MWSDWVGQGRVGVIKKKNNPKTSTKSHLCPSWQPSVGMCVLWPVARLDKQALTYLVLSFLWESSSELTYRDCADSPKYSPDLFSTTQLAFTTDETLTFACDLLYLFIFLFLVF